MVGHGNGKKMHGQGWKKKKPFKTKKETSEMDSYKKAKILRNYAKLCVAEGIQSDRVHIGPRDDKDSTRKKKEKVAKANPFKRAELNAQESKMAVEAEREKKKNKELEIEHAKKKNNEKKKLITARTKKGQPILSNQISLVMQKLQSSS
jgi:hypothetical protein